MERREDQLLFADGYLQEVRDALMTGSVPPERFDRILQQLSFVLHTQFEYARLWNDTVSLVVTGSVDDVRLVRERAPDAADLGELRSRIYAPDHEVTFESAVEAMRTSGT